MAPTGMETGGMVTKGVVSAGMATAATQVTTNTHTHTRARAHMVTKGMVAGLPPSGVIGFWFRGWVALNAITGCYVNVLNNTKHRGHGQPSGHALVASRWQYYQINATLRHTYCMVCTPSKTGEAGHRYVSSRGRVPYLALHIGSIISVLLQRQGIRDYTRYYAPILVLKINSKYNGVYCVPIWCWKFTANII